MLVSKFYNYHVITEHTSFAGPGVKRTSAFSYWYL